MADTTMLDALKEFAGDVTAKRKAHTHGEPEEQLRVPFEDLMAAAGKALEFKKLVCIAESRLKALAVKKTQPVLVSCNF